MKILRSLLLGCVSLCGLNATAYAAAFQLYELGTPIIGTAGVGQAAVAEDASTSYFNPAGMSALPSSQFMVGAQAIAPTIDFSQNSQNTILGDNGGGNVGSLTPGMGLYYVYRFNPRMQFGISFTAPYGGFLNYTDGWVGRYVVQDMEFYTLNLNPSLSYRINKWASVGVGVAVEYANLHETVALPIVATPTIDGQASIKTSNTALGYNAGVLFQPTDSTKIGIAYRSRIIHELTGDTTFLRIAVVPHTTTKMVMPQNIILSVVQKVSDQFNLLGELGWSNWATMRNTIVVIDGFTASIPRHWINTYRIGLGGQYQLSDAWRLQAGASYDSSPTSASLRLPDLPMDRQVRLGAGVMYNVMQAVNIGLSYEYINFGSANINNTSANGILAGSYSSNYANVVQASINVNC